MSRATIAAFVGVATLAFAGGDALMPELVQVVTTLQPITAALSPAPEVKPAGPLSLTVSYRTRTFKVHGDSKTGEYAAEAHDEAGPTAKGFVLFVEVQKRGEVNQAKTPQTLRRPYWETYIQVTPVAGSDTQLYWALSYGSQTDAKLLAQIRQAIEAVSGGSPVIDATEQAPVVVSSREEADSVLGRTVAVVGEARRGKTPNLQVTPDFHVTCIGGFRFRDISGKKSLDWPEDVVGRQVRVTGRLEKRYLGETHGLPGMASNFGYFLRDGTAERTEPRQNTAPPPPAPPAGPSQGAR
jgi:hypothetical protein